MLDRYYHGESRRISPEAPVPVVHVEAVEERAGAGANVALNIVALGAKTHLAGIVGKDEAAKTLLDLLKSHKINCTGVQSIKDHCTTVKLRVLSQNQQLLRLDFEDDSKHVTPCISVASLESHIKASDVVVISDYGKGGLPDIKKLIDAASSYGVPVVIDPKGVDFEIYSGATLLTPNLYEFELAIGAPINTEKDIEEHGLRMLKSLKLDALLITRGKDGMTLIQLDHKPYHIAAEMLEVYDVTGAGDTVVATLSVALGAGLEVMDATRLANTTAGIAVGRMGTTVVNVAELEDRLNNQTDVTCGIMDHSDLMRTVKTLRRMRKKIVFTNGCYDILHSGHVSTVEHAAKLGDYLIVAINSDDSVQRLKGSGRPINSLEERMKVVSALQAVDCVVSFDKDTPRELLELIKPDILAKGGDYKKDQVVCFELVEGYGGEVVVLDEVPNISTTAILKQGRQAR